MQEQDKKEWDETLVLLKEGNETVSSDMSFGTIVSLTEELFHNMIKEINDSRMKKGNIQEGVELIVVNEGGNEEDSVVSGED